MSPRPAIFISAVSKELRSARQLVSNTLTFLGYEPEWQDIFSTEEGDLREMLRRRLDTCKAVVQVVGQCYGAEPPAPDEEFGRVSYTQYEALYARQHKKKVWYLILNDDFTTDPHDPESQELHDLQIAYRRRLKSGNVVHHSLGTRDALEANVLKLRDELTRLRRGVKRWAWSVAVLLLLSVALGFWLLQKVAVMDDKLEKLLRQGTIQLPDVQSRVREEQTSKANPREMLQLINELLTKLPDVELRIRQEQTTKADPREVQQRTYEVLAKELGIDAKVLEEKLPQFANELRKDPNALVYERASAAYVAKDYIEAERLALVAADEAKKASKASDAIKALELAGNSADARIEYPKALQHFREAAQLTDRTRDALEWARQQWKIAHVLDEQGNYPEAEATYRDALSEYQHARGDEDKDVLTLRNDLANALSNQGKLTEAETQFLEVLMFREKVLGLEHPETLASRNDLANVLSDQGRYAEAEAQLRRVIQLGEKVLGPLHPDTLRRRNNLAGLLYRQGRLAEAEMQYREVVKLLEEELGPEHPDTLKGRHNLAVVLQRLGRYVEAETQYQKVIRLWEKVLGPEHPYTLDSRNNLAVVLRGQGKYAEAETQYREVLKLREKVLGPEHPETLRSCFNLASCLKVEMKMDEARAFARRAAEGAVKVLGANHPDTLDYQKLWQELQEH